MKSIFLRFRVASMLIGLTVGAISGNSTMASVITFGTVNLFGYTYPTGSNPMTGATLQGLASNAVTFANNGYTHAYPFSPSAGDFPGTDQIYVGSVQTAMRDGYAAQSVRIGGPDVLTMNYISLVPTGQSVSSLTLGIAADDFQYPAFGDPFAVTVNGVSEPSIASALMSDDMEIQGVDAGYEQFLSIGIDPLILNPSGVLTLSINEGGDGGDGWAVDFATVGVTTVPEPISLIVVGATLPVSLLRRTRKSGSGSGVTIQ